MDDRYFKLINMEITALKHTLSRLKANEFSKALNKWTFLKRNQLEEVTAIVTEDRKKTKLSMVAELVEYCKVTLQYSSYTSVPRLIR